MDVGFFAHEIVVYFFALLFTMTVLGTALIRTIVKRRSERCARANFPERRRRQPVLPFVAAASAFFVGAAAVFSVVAYHPLLADRHLARAMRIMKESPRERMQMRAELARATAHLREAETMIGSEPFMALLERRWGSFLDLASRELPGPSDFDSCPARLNALMAEVDAFRLTRRADERRRDARLQAERTYFLARCLAEAGDEERAVEYLSQAFLIDPRYRDRAQSGEPMRRIMEIALQTSR
ncbi:MAG: hypothetical protein HYY84_04945 [Deltaproteobacteria bacterium]|nr:hypothetical protein [Deltaproteobacteria bacterium]